MLKRLSLAFSVVSVIGLSLAAGVAHAHETTIVGVVTRVEPGRMEVMTDRRETLIVGLTRETTYLKWLVAKPWQQDLRTDLRSVRTGRRVHVDATSGPRPVARTVWVVTGRPGID